MTIPNKLNKMGNSKKKNTKWVQPIVARDVSNLGALWANAVNIERATNWPHWALDDVPSNDGYTGSQWQTDASLSTGSWLWALPDKLLVKKISISQGYSAGANWNNRGRLYKDKDGLIPLSEEFDFVQGNNVFTDIVFEIPVILEVIYIKILSTTHGSSAAIGEVKLEGEYLCEKEWKPWVQPVLSSNGSYGVIERSQIYNGYDVWPIFDGYKPPQNDCFNKYWAFDTSSGWFSWTLPVMLKIKKIIVYDNVDIHELDCQFYADPNNTKKIGDSFHVSKTYGHVDYNVCYEIIPNEPVVTNYIKLLQNKISGGWGGVGEIEIEADYYNPSKYSWIQPVVESAIPEVTATGGCNRGDEPYSILTSKPAFKNAPYNSNMYYAVPRSGNVFWMWKLKKIVKIYGFWLYKFHYTKDVQFFADENASIELSGKIIFEKGDMATNVQLVEIKALTPTLTDTIKIKMTDSHDNSWAGFSQLYILADEI